MVARNRNQVQPPIPTVIFANPHHHFIMATAQQPIQPNVAEETPVAQDQPIPMSFPALLRSGRNPQLAYLQQERLPLNADRSKRNLSKQSNEGKRWMRRRENGEF